MNINFENVPSGIFDWIEKLPFEELSDSQKKEVLAYFSEQEYDEIHLTSVSIRSTSVYKSANDSLIRNKLVNHFNKYHNSKATESFFPGKLLIWQAAALILVVISAWLFYNLFNLKKESDTQQIAQVDTVYITKEIVSTPQIIHDTVYSYKKDETTSLDDSYSGDTNYNTVNIEPLYDAEDLYPVELENISTMPRGISMKDDSLLKKFGFVSL